MVCTEVQWNTVYYCKIVMYFSWDVTFSNVKNNNNYAGWQEQTAVKQRNENEKVQVQCTRYSHMNHHTHSFFVPLTFQVSIQRGSETVSLNKWQSQAVKYNVIYYKGTYLENLDRYICRNLKPGCFNVLLSANLFQNSAALLRDAGQFLWEKLIFCDLVLMLNALRTITSYARRVHRRATGI